MKIEINTVPSVTYTLSVDGELIESTSSENPLVFLFGSGGMIPGFEKELEGLEIGDTYDFVVEPSEGYGDINPDAIIGVPLDVFKVDGEIDQNMMQIGNVLPMQDQNGMPMEGTIVSISEEEVTMDFNHMLAGKTLHFTGEIIDIRKAEEEEITHGHVHGPGGHHH
jgi:FKBP-type peptidyl-prolyl cis-trans isomerase SlyD